VAELSHPATGSPLEVLAAARELSGATDAALRAAVDRARAAGQSWSRIGEVLGTTRQAAFQRFGRPDLAGDPPRGREVGGAQAS
jgi:acyl-CoA reductase-like NAD-dependent aldehyde dehydrogenase